MARILDISQPVGTRTAVWPGDQPPALSWTMSRASGDSVNVAALTLSAHTGTHVDGPFHVDDDGARAADLDLARYVGPADVIDARGRAVLDVGALEGRTHVAERVLFRTRDDVDPTVFPDRVVPVTPALARALGEAGVRLIGTDAPSVDPIDSKTLDAHHALIDSGIAILENLVLTDVSPGRYTLVALPLRLTEADSSPVRAILIEAEP
jgi:arylformamidase